ncbi:C39 family peptidase [Schleiferilactobacillus shenzhenensis]|uniref:Peptidase C39-like domain-containing protein n=1 Tax=Schleiferilactobacillus shenzhenensis LY-73 TaxID=1231336 RepID=U4TIC6_9LACO|nr:C39 family peptidase [Schleiferilactobacillus shenzhenensis]ERL64556.1 hypothetical protein L248_0851 [Schleiferilactobacillus shenzhenensis LY-73]
MKKKLVLYAAAVLLGIGSLVAVGETAAPAAAADVNVVTVTRPTTLWQGYGENRTATGRTLPINSRWQIVDTATDADGTTWYEVGTGVWLSLASQYNPATPVTFPPLKVTQVTTTYAVPGDITTKTGRTLAAGTRWQVTNEQTVADAVWYQIATNTWVSTAAAFNPQPAAPTTYPNLTLTFAHTVYGQPGGTATGQTLSANSRWKVTGQQVLNGMTWSQVGRNAWVTDDPAFNRSAFASIRLSQPTILWTGYGADRQSTGRTLATGSAWQVVGTATVDGVTWYEIGSNQWVTMAAQVNGNDNHFSNATLTVTVNQPQGATVYDTYQSGRQAVRTLGYGSRWRVSQQAVANDGSLWYQVGTNQWLSAASGIAAGVAYPASASLSGVPLIAQRPELPNGCEITAVTMMLRYAGANVDKMQLAREMPRSSNPNQGYMGNPWDSTGVTIFPPALMGLVKKYAGNSINMTGMSFDAIKYQVGIRRHPVVAWMTMHGFPYHAIVIIGYDASGITYLDCWTNQQGRMSTSAFMANWATQNRRAISY